MDSGDKESRAKKVVEQTIKEDPDQFNDAVLLHNARSFKQVVTNGDMSKKLPATLDYSFPLNSPRLTGKDKELSVPYSMVDDSTHTLKDRIDMYLKKFPNWMPEMAEVAARIDFESRRSENGNWGVINNKKEFKKAKKALELDKKRKERRSKGKNRVKFTS